MKVLQNKIMSQNMRWLRLVIALAVLCLVIGFLLFCVISLIGNLSVARGQTPQPRQPARPRLSEKPRPEHGGHRQCNNRI